MLGGVKDVTSEWRWFTDNVLLWSDWNLNCPADRVCQVGMDIRLGGDPLGEKIRFSGTCEFKTVGGEAIHVRVVDDKGALK